MSLIVRIDTTDDNLEKQVVAAVQETASRLGATAVIFTKDGMQPPAEPKPSRPEPQDQETTRRGKSSKSDD